MKYEAIKVLDGNLDQLKRQYHKCRGTNCVRTQTEYETINRAL